MLSINHSIKNTLEENVQQIIWTHYYFTHSITLPDCWPSECCSPFHNVSLPENYNAALSRLFTARDIVFYSSSGLFIINANCKFPSPALQWEKPLGSHLTNDKWYCVYILWWKNFKRNSTLPFSLLALKTLQRCLPNLNESFPLKVFHYSTSCMLPCTEKTGKGNDSLGID